MASRTTSFMPEHGDLAPDMVVRFAIRRGRGVILHALDGAGRGRDGGQSVRKRGWLHQARIVTMGRSVVLVALGVLTSFSALASQVKPRLNPARVGLGLDTLKSPNSDLIALWRNYLRTGPFEEQANQYWFAPEQRRWPTAYDLATPWCYGSRDDFANTQAIVLDISPATFGDSTSHAIRTLFSYQDSTMAEPLPFAVCRVYAVRQAGRWVLANALGQLTREWQHKSIAPITFVYPPDHHFDEGRARRSARFVDSVATAFGANKPRPIEFYVAQSPENMFRVLGVEVLPHHTPGLAYIAHRLIFSGAAIYGEWYPHELAHMALDSLTTSWRTPFALDEGLAMWLGGSRGKDFPALMQDLAAALRAKPSITLDALLGSPSVTDTLAYPAAAALLQMAYERGQMTQVKAFLRARLAGEVPDTILKMAERTFQQSHQQLTALWRSRVLQYQSAGGVPRKEG